MLESGQNWELFGYDTRNLGRQITAAFREFIWSYDSPLRERLDEVVCLRDGDREQHYHAGKACEAAPSQCKAVLLPEDLALTRQLRFPLAVEAELEGAVALEAAASSPFASADTGVGWQVASRDEQYLYVQLVIVSLSAAMTYISHHYGSHDAHAQEVWVLAGERLVVVRGFGEAVRERLYRQRLLRVVSMIGVAAALLFVLVLAGAGSKKWELERLSALEQTTRQEAAEAMRLRSVVGDSNELIAAVNEISSQYPNPHMELARLTHLLEDSAYIDRLSIEGREMDIQGKAVNAAQMMELLTKQDAWSGVTAGSPIRKLPNSNREQFHLKIQRGLASD
ncbi:PilN domain-containing protein [Haliea sp. E17]|uniref:PilN domain-containing protein n=1 Tax=Haliea sp. E17 TaxID=3401576 RepID=UPI003AAB0674